MFSQRLKTPLRYPGGKRKLADFVQALLKKNRLIGCDYAEPYAGGAGLAIELLRREAVRHVFLNDIDKNIYSFWHSVLTQTDDFCSLIEQTPVTIDEWFHQKECLNSSDPLIRGFATFFLNRTNRSGIILGGVIGGKNQTGKWKLDCRFNKSDLISRIREIGNRSENFTFTNIDALEFIKLMQDQLSEFSLINLDPPYYVKGSGLYENHYQHSDHQKVAEAVKCIGTPWIVSYDNHEKIKELYEGIPEIQYRISYSASLHKKGDEIIFSGNLNTNIEAFKKLL